jgi:hypothetical protein
VSCWRVCRPPSWSAPGAARRRGQCAAGRGGVEQPRGLDPARARRQGRRHRPDRQQDRRRRAVTRVASAAAPTTAIARSNIFAFDATTGAIDTAFAPVRSFTKINGVAQKSLAKLRLRDGARIAAFKGKTNARVKDMAVSGGRLYIGGTFKTANGVARSALAAVDPVTGALSADVNLAITGPRNGTVKIDKFDITPDGTRLIAIGNWTYVAGLQRDQIVMLDLTPAR